MTIRDIDFTVTLALAALFVGSSIALVPAQTPAARPAADPARIYRVGDVFYEPQMHAHRLLRNASQTEPAELLLFQVFDKGAPTAIGVK
jgi:hypothetical protein